MARAWSEHTGTRDANGVDLEVISHRKRLLELVPGATDVHWQRDFPAGITIAASPDALRDCLGRERL